MKAKTFENLIRKIVREEIDYALRREIKSLKEDLQDKVKPSIIEQPQSIKKSIKEEIKNIQPSKSYEKKQFSGNPTLNDLLNETAQSGTNLESGNSPVSLSESFTPGSPAPMETTGMPKEVANAVTRDYSDLMKAINNKKKK